MIHNRYKSWDKKFLQIPRKSLMVAFTAVVMLLSSGQNAEPIGKGSTMVDFGLTFGTKSGALVGIKYFVLDDVALGIDLIAGPAGRVHLGIGSEINYYPPILGGYAYVGMGLSFMYSLQEQPQGDSFVPVQTSVLALNFGVGANTWTFQMPPAIESTNKNDVPTVVYSELGFARILSLQIRTNGIVAQNPGATWYFPNFEIGIRQGPFKPSWVQ